MKLACSLLDVIVGEVLRMGVFCGRWMLVGAYVGFATVGVFCAWYMFDSFLGIDLSGDNHTTVTWHQLRNWESCHTWSDFKVLLPTGIERVM